jgi:hypothetical protein
MVYGERSLAAYRSGAHFQACVARLGEGVDSLTADITSVRESVESGDLAQFLALATSNAKPAETDPLKVLLSRASLPALARAHLGAAKPEC